MLRLFSVDAHFSLTLIARTYVSENGRHFACLIHYLRYASLIISFSMGRRGDALVKYLYTHFAVHWRPARMARRFADILISPELLRRRPHRFICRSERC